MKKQPPIVIKRLFDKLFDTYCPQLTRGITTKMFVPDTEANRIILGEFENYLQQRATYEGWEYKTGNFQVVYSDKISGMNNEVRLANPYGENVGLEEIDRERGLFKRLNQKRADKIRDILDIIDVSEPIN